MSPGDGLGFLDLGARHAGAVGGDGDGVVAQRKQGRLGDDGAVDAAAEGDGDTLHTAQQVNERFTFHGEIHLVMIKEKGAASQGSTLTQRPPLAFFFRLGLSVSFFVL